MNPSKPLLVIRHVPWEGPHRILDAFGDTPVLWLDVLESDAPLPDPRNLCGALVMGGPMSVNDTERYPRLAEEVRWLGEALTARLPILGVCLGSQLLARALGASVGPGRAPEIGFAPIDVLDRGDPLIGALDAASGARPHVLHWHGEAFELPAGAIALARSEITTVQAFRYADHAWGLLFHAEADTALIEQWLAQPTMAVQARCALGEGYAAILRAEAREDGLVGGAAVFEAFARRCIGA